MIKLFTKLNLFTILYRMKTVFSDFIEAEEYLRKHLDLPEKVKFRSILKTNVVEANEQHPALIDLHQGLMPEYHNRKPYVAITPKETPVKNGSQWVMVRQYDEPWIFVDTTTWEEITEEEFIAKVKAILVDKKNKGK